MPKRIEIAGFGAGAHDYFRPVGEVDADHVPGAKKSKWTDHEDRLLRALAEAGCETHVGGNVLNALTRLACSDALASNVRFVSALGHDETSDAIRAELQRFGIQPETTTSADYLPSVSIVERKDRGGCRHRSLVKERRSG
jgi:sugar/nucleoside kinase (ribokinase family)